MTLLSSYIEPLKTISREAGEAILEIYNDETPLEVDTKSDDSPVTKADLAAHRVIHKSLQDLTPEIPILSEEGGMPDYEERRNWQSYWLVDPLDGTKEFINRNGEFTVNIALIQNGQAVLGVVYVPVKSIMYWGLVGEGSWKESTAGTEKLSIRKLSFDRELKVVGSRRHGAEALDKLMEQVGTRFNSVDLVSMGSSLKICALAEGSADWYPRLALTSEWDTAAAHAVLNGAGGKIMDISLNALTYNAKDSLLNPFFHAVGDINFDWEGLLEPA